MTAIVCYVMPAEACVAAELATAADGTQAGRRKRPDSAGLVGAGARRHIPAQDSPHEVRGMVAGLTDFVMFFPFSHPASFHPFCRVYIRLIVTGLHRWTPRGAFMPLLMPPPRRAPVRWKVSCASLRYPTSSKTHKVDAAHCQATFALIKGILPAALGPHGAPPVSKQGVDDAPHEEGNSSRASAGMGVSATGQTDQSQFTCTDETSSASQDGLRLPADMAGTYVVRFVKGMAVGRLMLGSRSCVALFFRPLLRTRRIELDVSCRQSRVFGRTAACGAVE
jgi:hypothetical protein